jgi:arabinogalactan endo-1,4-beta-galactosidase
MEFIKGMDLSSLKEVEACGGRFYNEGKEQDVIDILKKYGMNSVRLRLWNHPYTQEGIPYGAGTNDLDTTIELAKRCLSRGMTFLLDFHYSDFWTDPGKQFPPKEWRGYNISQLEQTVYDYTRDVMKRLKEEKAYPSLVQIGNEVSNGLLWPNGKVPDYDNIAKFINAGIRAVRSLDQEIPIMLHLDGGGNNGLYREWFDNYIKRGEDFQIIGLSYYPFWNGKLEALSHNMNDIAKRYGKELIIAEVSMGHTTRDYADYEKLAPSERKGMATKPELLKDLEHPMTEQGQADFMQGILECLRLVPDGLGRGFYYWEPAWLPVPGSGWASPEALAYIGEAGPGGNEWANQALFDYEGNALPALKVIRDWKAE